MSESNNFLSPIGRIVQGDCWEGQTTDAENKPLVYKSGPDAGKPRQQWFIALAISKQDPGWPELQQKIMNEARSAFPTLFNEQGQCLRRDFSFKIKDGDSQVANSRGVKNCDREGWAGHWIVSFSNGFAPTVWNRGGKEKLLNPESVKRGYYVRVFGSAKGNGSNNQPGVFLNFSYVEFCGFGETIDSAPSADEIFKSTSAYTPAGMSTAPLATAAPGASAPPANGAQGSTPPTTAPNITPPTTATAPIPENEIPFGDNVPPPHTEFLNGPVNAPAAQPKVTMTAKAGATTYDQFIAQGWTQDQMRAQGYCL